MFHDNFKNDKNNFDILKLYMVKTIKIFLLKIKKKKIIIGSP